MKNNKHLIRLVIGIIVALLSLFNLSCSESTVIGEDFIDTNNFNVSQIDTISIQLGTVRFDSIITSNTGRLLVGNHDIPIGKIESQGYFNITYLSSETYEAETHLQFDSLVLQLPMDGYTNHLDESGSYYTLNLYQLGDQLDFRDDGSLYNLSELPEVDANLLEMAQGTFFFASDRQLEYTLRLQDDLGEDLLYRIKYEDDIFYTSADFKSYMKGFKLVIEDSDASMIGFDADSLRFILYATDEHETPPTQHSYEFRIDDAPYYSKIITSEIIDELGQLEDLDDQTLSDSTDNVSYIQGGSGYAVKVDLRSIRNLLISDQDYIIAGASLQFSWLDADSDVIPENLTAYFVDDDNIDLTGQSYQLLLNHDDVYNRDNYYSLDITSFIPSFLEPLTATEIYLIIFFDDFNTSSTSIILGDDAYDSKLNIYTISNNK